MKKLLGILQKKKRIRLSATQDYYQSKLNTFGAEQLQKIANRGLRVGLANV